MPKENLLNSGKPKAVVMVILSESSGDIGSVQRLTAGTERPRSGYIKNVLLIHKICKHGRHHFVDVSKMVEGIV